MIKKVYILEFVCYNECNSNGGVKFMTIEKVKKLISNQLNVAEANITAESKLIEDLGADSLDTVEMLMAFEEEFGISIPDEEAMNIKTVQNIVDIIDGRK